MITSNVFSRLFFIKDQDYGSSFAIDYENRQYLITAKHIVPAAPKNGIIQLYHEKAWKDLKVELVGLGDGEIDIVVLAPKVRLSPALKLEPTAGGIIIGQDVYFLGYPYKMWAEVGEINRNLPFPYIKKGILSSSFNDEDGIQRFFIDAINNPGFSGGPIVFTPPNKVDFKVAAVVSKFKIEFEEILNMNGEKTDLQCAYNTGFLIGYGIKHAIDLIKQNPIGFELNS